MDINTNNYSWWTQYYPSSLLKDNQSCHDPIDPLVRILPSIYKALRRKFTVDNCTFLYIKVVITKTYKSSWLWLDRFEIVCQWWSLNLDLFFHPPMDLQSQPLSHKLDYHQRVPLLPKLGSRLNPRYGIYFGYIN